MPTPCNEYSGIIYIKPQVKQRARLGKFGCYTPAKTVNFERAVSWSLTNQLKGQKPLVGPVELMINFFFNRPHKSKRDYPSRGDLSNFLKAFEDAANGILWMDDVQVVKIVAQKLYTFEDKIVYTVKELP